MPGPTLSCPMCSATLRLANPVAAGKHVRCPKCGNAFLPSAQGISETASPAAPTPRQRDDERRPKKKKFRPKKQGVNPVLIIAPIIAFVVVLLLGGAVGAILLIRSHRNNTTVASAPATKPPVNPTPVPDTKPPEQPPVNSGPGPAGPPAPDVPGLPGFPGAGPNIGPGPMPAGPKPNDSKPSGPPPVPKDPVIGLSVGNIAPDILGQDIDGKKFKLSDYRGKVVVIDFWGNW
jgi:hypothetical protein